MNPLNAAAALMSRLTYAQKFLLLGLVLLAPAGFALHAYWRQGETLAFADSERAGVRFVAPANELAVQVAAARGAAVRAARRRGSRAALPAAAAAVARRSRPSTPRTADGARSARTRPGSKTRATVLEAATRKVAASPKAAYDGLRAPRRGRVALVVKAGDGSKLILDPDLDSYYVMDALITKLPALADWTGRAADLQAIVAAPGRWTTGSRSRARRARWSRPRPR